MVKKDIVTAKLGELADRIGQIRLHRRTSAADLTASRADRDLVSFNLMLSVQACADIAGHLIADEGWPVATTLAESFVRLHERAVISSRSAMALASAVGLRNIVAHGHTGVDPQLLHVASVDGVVDLERYAREVSQWLLTQP